MAKSNRSINSKVFTSLITRETRSRRIFAVAAAAGLTALLGHTVRAQNTELDVILGASNLNSGSSYTSPTGGSTTPSTSSDVKFPSSITSGTSFYNVTSGTLSIGTLNDLTTKSLTLQGSAASTALTLNGGTNSVAPSSSDLLYVASGGSLSVPSGSNNFSLGLGASSGNLDVVGALTIGAAFSGSGTITKTGAGTLTISKGTNNFTGNWVISAGTVLPTSNATTLQNPQQSNFFTVNGGTVDLKGAGSGDQIGMLNGSGGIVTNSGSTASKLNIFGGTTASYSGAITGNLAVVLNSNSYTPGSETLTGSNTYTGGTTLTTGTLAGNTVGLQGNISAGTGTTLLFDQTLGTTPITSGTYAGVISGPGSVVKNNAGTVIFAGNNTITGGTTVNAGTLALTYNPADQASTGTLPFSSNIAVNSAGTLLFEVEDALGFTSNPGVLSINGGLVTTSSAAVSGGFMGSSFRVTLPIVNMSGGTLSSDPNNSGDGAGDYLMTTVNTLASTSTAVINAGLISANNRNLLFNVALGSVTTGPTPGVDLSVSSNLTNFFGGFTGLEKEGPGWMLYTGTASNIAGGQILVGQFQNGGTLEFGTGANVNTTGRFNVGGGNSTALGVVNVDAGAGTLTFGGNGSDLANYIGVDSGNGTMNVAGGTINFGPYASSSAVGYLRIGATLGATGLLNVTEGTVNVGTSASLNAWIDGSDTPTSSVATLSISGGIVNIGTSSATGTTGATGYLYLGNSGGGIGSATVNLTGGTLSLVEIAAGTSAVDAVNFNGGTLQATVSNTDFLDQTSALTVSINSGGAIIDTQSNNITISANLLNGGPGGALTKIGTGNLTLSGSNSYAGSTLVSAGSLTLATGEAFPTGTTLNVSSGAAVTLSNHGTNPTSVPVLGSLANTGMIDLTNNALIVHNGAINVISTQVAAAYNGGAWNGSTGAIITSSVAAADTSHLTAVGVATGLSTFEGSPVLPTDVLIKYTYYGDANLDGKVDGSDYSLIDNGFLSHLTGWQNGDFNYDGVVDGSDYTLIDNAFNVQGTPISAEIATPTAQIAGTGATSAVPEPATLGLLGLVCMHGLLGRRHRRAQ